MNKDAENIIVSIQCLVYNHEPYLRQCLEGFVMQKTNFKFEAIVHDDVSTDGSAKIIAEYAAKYPDIIKPIYETENQYSKRDGSLERIMNEACRGKYIAFCEGDDYWTDPNKLQKQLEFLEADASFAMCYTDFDVLYNKTGKLVRSCFKNYPQEFPKYFTLEDFVVYTGYMCPPSWMYRADSLPQNRAVSVDGSFVMFTHFLATSKVHCLDINSCVYRILEESASHSNDYSRRLVRNKGLLETKYYLIDHYGLSSSLKDVCKSVYYNDSLILLLLANKLDELDDFRNCKSNKSLTVKIILFLSCTLLGRWIVISLYKVYCTIRHFLRIILK